MKINVYLLILVSIVSLSVFAAETIEPNEDQLLLTSRQALATAPDQESTKSCIYFIQSFVAVA